MLDRRIVYNTIIASGARIIGLVLSLVIIGFVTRYLGQDGYGYYATIMAFLFFFNVLADLGLHTICLREISRPGANEEKIVSNIFTLRFFAGLLVFAMAPMVIRFFPYPDQVKTGVLLAMVGFWLMSNQQVLVGVFRKYLRMDKVALGELLGRLTQLGLVLFFIQRDFGFLFIVSAVIGGSLINFILIFFLSQRYVHIYFRFDFSFWRKLLKESLPLALAIIFTVIYFRIDTIMLSLMKTPADVGIYNLAYKFLESLLFFPTMFVGLIMPLMSKYAFSAKEKFKQVVQDSLDVLLVFIVPMIIGIIFLSKRIVVLIAGRDFILSAGPLNILIVAAGIIFLGTLFSYMIISLNLQKKLIYIYGTGVVVNLIANFIFIPRYSYYGAAGTTLLTELIVTALMLVVLAKALNRLPSFKLIFKYCLAGLIMALVLYFLANWSLSILIIISALVYFIFLYLIGGFSAKKVLTLIKKDA